MGFSCDFAFEGGAADGADFFGVGGGVGFSAGGAVEEPVEFVADSAGGEGAVGDVEVLGGVLDGVVVGDEDALVSLGVEVEAEGEEVEVGLAESGEVAVFGGVCFGLGFCGGGGFLDFEVGEVDGGFDAGSDGAGFEFLEGLWDGVLFVSAG